MNPTVTFLHGILDQIYRPKSRESMAEWAEHHITLPPIEGAFSGMPYIVDRFPLVRVLFDWWQDESGEFPEMSIMKGSQGGLTLGAAICAAHDFAHDPVSILYMANNDSMAANVGKMRFVPILKQAAADISDAIDDSGEAAVFKRIRGCLFMCCGGQVPSKLASWPIPRVIVDEAALHKTTDNGTTIDLADMRTQKQPRRKVLAFSKPEEWPVYSANPRTNALTLVSGDGSRFTERWMSGTQEVPMVPCPHCGGFQELTDAQFRAPAQLLPGINLAHSDMDLSAVERETWYECVHCHHPIYERHKAEMVKHFRMEAAPLDAAEAKKRGFARPRMVASDPRHPDIVKFKRPLPGRRSIHISDLYNISAQTCSFGALHRRKLEAERDTSAFGVYCKDVKGEPPPLEIATATLTSVMLQRLCGAYPRLQVLDPNTGVLQGPQYSLPCEAVKLFLTVDYQAGQLGQGAYFPFLLTAFDVEGRPYICDWGNLRDLDTLYELLAVQFVQKLSGQKGRVSKGLMDAQHRPGDVFEFVKRPGVYGRLFPSRGVSKDSPVYAVNLTRKEDLPFWAYNYNSSYWEGQLYRWKLGRWCEILDPSRPGLIHSASAKKHAAICPRPFLPVDADDDLYQQLSNMHEDYANPKDPGKGLIWKKVHPSKPNDFGDMFKLALISWRLFAPNAEMVPMRDNPQAA